MANWIRAWDELAADERHSAGGKGRTLARLHQAGYPVPAGLVILPQAFDGDRLKPDAWPELEARLQPLRAAGGVMAVRSSALGEDSARASYAGAYETVLNVRGDDQVRAALETVRRSRHAERVQQYRAAQGLPADGEMAVVIQQLVPADLSGVLFTADPVTGSRTQMTGSFVSGLGEGLVAGETEGQAFELAWPRGTYDGPPALKSFARKLFKLGKRLERELGSPQDIEWAVAGRRLYLLQARPITSLQGFDPHTGEWNDSRTGDFFWSSVNIGEAMSTVMTPFTWSVMGAAYDEMAVVPGYSPAGNIGGRAYNNVSVMAAAFRALGQDLDALNQEMGGVRQEYQSHIDLYTIPLPRGSLLPILWNGLRLRYKIYRGRRQVPAFLAENPAWCRAMHARIQRADNAPALLALWDEVDPYTRASFWPMVATAWGYGELAAKLRARLTELVNREDADTLLSNVSLPPGQAGPAGLLASLGPAVGLAWVARGQMSRQAYLERFGHRSAYETEFSSPRPAEDPDWLDDQLAALDAAPLDAEALLAQQRAAFETTWARFAGRYPHESKKLHSRLEAAAAVARDREAVRSEVAREIWVGRAWALRAGEITGLGDGIFHLTAGEVLDLLAGRGAPTETIPTRRETFERYRALPPYPLGIRGRFNPFQWAADPNRNSFYYDAHGEMEATANRAADPRRLTGTPGSAGRVEGMVRRLDRPEEGDQLQPGEVLVTNQTNIGWTLYFPRAAAVVTEVGAALSHAAIVARELGLPAVVNCVDATSRLQTGDRVRVDGTAGTVEILEQASS